MKVKNYNAEVFLEAGISYALTPDPYMYGGAIERLQEENVLLREMLARFIACQYGDESMRLTKKEQIEHILGSGFEVLE